MKSINYNDRESVESAIAEHEAAIKQHYAEIDRIRREHWEAAKNSEVRSTGVLILGSDAWLNCISFKSNGMRMKNDL